MKNKRIQVPGGMLAAAVQAALPMAITNKESVETFRIGLEAALLWQSENPPVPVATQWNETVRDWCMHHEKNSTSCELAVEWVRHMYDAPPEPDPALEAVKDLLVDQRHGDELWGDSVPPKYHDAHVLEAFRRGCANRLT